MFACCDESGIHKKSRWWVIGAFWLPADDELPAFEAEATKLRQRTACWGEFKWDKVGPAWVDTYCEFLGIALALPDVRFSSIVIDTDLFTPADMKKFNAKGGRREAFVKFMRLLLSHRIARLVDRGHEEFTLLYDKLSVRRELEGDLREVLKNDMRSIGWEKGRACRYEHLSQVDSKTLHLMQATDLVTGATWATWENASGLSTEKQAARQILRDQIEAWAGGNLTNEKFSSARYYNLWRWQPKT